jgi:hypothetical protein
MPLNCSINDQLTPDAEEIQPMTWTEKMSLVVVTVMFSFLGGAAAEHFWPAAVATAGAAKVPQNITAHRFTVVDGNGVTRGVIDVTGKGVAQVALLDSDGKLRAGLGVAKDGAPALALYEADGHTRAEVSLSRGTSRVRLFDLKGASRIGMAVNSSGLTNFALLDSAGLQRASIHVAEDGDPTLRLSDKSGPRIGLSVTETGSTGIALLGGGLTRAALSIDQTQNRSGLTIYGADGKLITSMP